MIAVYSPSIGPKKSDIETAEFSLKSITDSTALGHQTTELSVGMKRERSDSESSSRSDTPSTPLGVENSLSQSSNTSVRSPTASGHQRKIFTRSLVNTPTEERRLRAVSDSSANSYLQSPKGAAARTSSFSTDLCSPVKWGVSTDDVEKLKLNKRSTRRFVSLNSADDRLDTVETISRSSEADSRIDYGVDNRNPRLKPNVSTTLERPRSISVADRFGGIYCI
jgi:hypothetical protein